LYLSDLSFLGGGLSGRVFDVKTTTMENFHLPALVIKISNPGHEAELELEARCYQRLSSLQNCGLTAFYGLFQMAEEAQVHRAVVLSNGGKRIDSWSELSSSNK